MNAPNSEVLLDAVTLDRLVDGELSPAEYRQVLLALEQHPDAWRKCAEAFLQAQAWKRDFGELRASAEMKPAAAGTVELPQRSSRCRDWLRMLLVAAASFLLALFVSQNFWQVRQDPVAGPSSQPFAAIPEKEQPQLPPAVPDDVPESYSSPRNLPLGRVRLAVNTSDSGEPAWLDVPVFAPEAATEMVKSYRPALPDDLVKALEAEGHQIDRQGQYISVPLDDGQQMMVPVESYRIVPVSRPSY
jgi:hypothetical protein